MLSCRSKGAYELPRDHATGRYLWQRPPRLFCPLDDHYSAQRKWLERKKARLEKKLLAKAEEERRKTTKVVYSDNPKPITWKMPVKEPAMEDKKPSIKENKGKANRKSMRTKKPNNKSRRRRVALFDYFTGFTIPANYAKFEAKRNVPEILTDNAFASLDSPELQIVDEKEKPMKCDCAVAVERPKIVGRKKVNEMTDTDWQEFFEWTKSTCTFLELLKVSYI